MKQKTLKSYTVVPPELYVDREADRQLRTILDSGGRPGYVLVARQMGKTNLLLNAKRSYNSEDCIFAYLDASNPFPDVRAFFRNIVDVALDTGNSKTREVQKLITSERSVAQRLPHKEHEYELREILRAIDGKLIVCIDEIDALTRSSYSDEVFSFIRSTYFAGRANFVEFSRLTYLLSGVAEPAEIIKNKDISPFNIGDKIYLDDFSKPELSQLAKVTGLDFPEAVLQHLYDATGGHPRMSWDLISALEDVKLAGKELTADLVAGAINKLYFSDVDAPPIDHIKRLTEESHEVRDALMAIHYSRGSSIPESMRTKLYLAGITKGSPKTKGVSFKNKIIEDALSEQFLIGLETNDHTNLLRSVDTQVQEGLINEALLKLEPRLIQGSPDAQRAVRRKYLQLLAKTQQFSAVVTRSRLWNWKESGFPDEATHLLYALALYEEGQDREAFNELSQLQHSEAKEISYEATLGLIKTALRTPQGLKQADIKSLCEKLVHARAEILDCDRFTRRATIIYADVKYQYASLLSRIGESESARIHATEALEFAPTDLKIQTRLLLARLQSGGPQWMGLQMAIAELRSAKAYVYFADRSEDVSVETLKALLLQLERLGKSKVAEDLISEVLGRTDGVITPYDLTIQLVGSVNKVQSQLAITILEHATKVETYSVRERRDLLVLLIKIAGASIEKYCKSFLATFSDSEPVTSGDIVALNNIITRSLSWQNVTYANAALALIETQWYDTQTADELFLESYALLQQYLRSLLLLRGSASPGDVASARHAAEQLAKASNFSLVGFESDYLRQMRASLYHALSKFKQVPQKRSGPKLNRNQVIRVDYGTRIETGKYKKFESDIRNGLCRVLHDPTNA